MIRFLVLYPQPSDPAAFDQHYYDVHVPLALQLPGLRSYTTSAEVSGGRGDAPYHLVAELDFDDRETLQAGFASPLGAQLSADVEEMSKLCPGITSMIFEPAQQVPATG